MKMIVAQHLKLLSSGNVGKSLHVAAIEHLSTAVDNATITTQHLYSEFTRLRPEKSFMSNIPSLIELF